MCAVRLGAVYPLRPLSFHISNVKNYLATESFSLKMPSLNQRVKAMKTELMYKFM
jgi:hypothetical protein